MKRLTLLFFIFIFTTSSRASYGDEQWIYQQCVEECSAKPCERPSFWLKLFRWNCLDRCRYDCMQQDVVRRQGEGLDMVQYHGKWPFKRIAGIQELASVVFSILNGWQHWKGVQSLKSLPKHDMIPIYTMYGWINMNTWLWSTIFHCRDVYWTERMDYWGAALGIWFAMYQAVVKVFKLWETPWMLPWGIVVSSSYLAHVGYLASLTRFDYSYNMLACTTVGIICNLVWAVWCLQHKRRRYPWIMMAVVIGISLAMSLELLDFPPLYDLVDAHSLWHACTIPIVYAFYEFARRDVTYEVKMKNV